MKQFGFEKIGYNIIEDMSARFLSGGYILDDFLIGTRSIYKTTLYYLVICRIGHHSIITPTSHKTIFSIIIYDLDWTYLDIEGLFTIDEAYLAFESIPPCMSLTENNTKLYCSCVYKYITSPYAGAIKVAKILLSDYSIDLIDGLFSDGNDIIGYDSNYLYGESTIFESISYGENHPSFANLGAVYGSVDSTIANNRISRGCMVTSRIIQFIRDDGSDGVIVRRITGYASDNFSTVETISTSGASTIALNNSQYWKQGDVEIAIWPNNFYYKENSTSSWRRVAGLDGYQPIAHWIENIITHQFDIQGWSFGSTYIELFNSKIIIKNTQSTQIFISAWGDYNIDYAGEISTFGLEITEQFATQQLTTETYKGNILNSEGNFEPIDNQFLQLYTDAEQLYYQGYIRSYNFDGEKYVYSMQSPISDDLGAKVTVSFVTKTIDYILKYVIDNFCIYLYYISGITVDPLATEYTIEWKDKTVLDVFRWADSLRNYQVSVRPSFEVFWDNYTDSTITIDDATDSLGSPDSITLKKTPLKVSIITVYGALVNGVRLSATALGDATGGDLQDRFSQITNQTDLQEIANSIRDNKNRTLTLITFSVQGKGLFYYGQTITLTLSKYGISGDTYYVLGSCYDPIQDICIIKCTDVLYLIPTSSTNTIEETVVKHEDDIQNLNQDVQNTAEEVAVTIHADGSVPFTADQSMGEYKLTNVGGIKTEIITIDSSISTTVDDYKKAGADDWGSSGEPTGWTKEGSPTIAIGSYGNHANACYIQGDAGGQSGIYKDITATGTLITSAWITPLQTASYDVYYILRDNANTTNRFVVKFDSTGKIQYAVNAGSYSDIGTAYTTEFYYIQIQYNQHATSYLFVCDKNGHTLIYLPFTAPNFTIDRIAYISDANGDFYLDATYNGIDFKAAWGSLYPDAILSRQLITRYGKYGDHLLDFMNMAAFTYVGTSGTNGGTVILDFFLGTSTETNVTQTSESWIAKAPPNAKAVKLLLRVASSAPNTAHEILIRRNGNTNFYQTLRQNCGGVANYPLSNSDYVSLSADGKVEVYVSWASSGTITFQIMLMGYKI